jgi:hypothetical protein
MRKAIPSAPNATHGQRRARGADNTKSAVSGNRINTEQ